MFYSQHAKGSVNFGKETVNTEAHTYWPKRSPERLLSTLESLQKEGIDVWMVSQFPSKDTSKLQNALKKIYPSYVPKFMFNADDYFTGSKKSEKILKAYNNCLWSQISSRSIDIKRTIILDELSTRFKKLSRSRVWSIFNADRESLKKHILSIFSNKGDLRRIDKEFYHEDYAEVDFNCLKEWAASLSCPEGAKAENPKESLLVLDIDGTLIFTDTMTPISAQGRLKYIEQNRLFYGIMTSIEDLESVRKHDYTHGEVGGWARPGLREFMKFAKEHFDKVCFYTAAKQEYVDFIFEHILEKELMPDFVLNRSHCFQQRRDSYGKSIFLLNHLGYSSEKVVIIEDRPQYYLCSRKNMIEVMEYFGSSDDTVLSELSDILLKVSTSKDFRKKLRNKRLHPWCNPKY